MSTREGVVARLLARPARTLVVTLAEDPADADRLARLRVKVAQARRNVSIGAGSQAEVGDAEAELDEYAATIATVRFTFVQVAPSVVDALEDKHRPTEHQKTRFRMEQKAAGSSGGFLRYNPDTYPAALVAASLSRVEFSDGTVLDGLSEDDTAALWASERWPQGDLEELFSAAQMVSRMTTSVGDLGKDSETTTT